MVVALVCNKSWYKYLVVVLYSLLKTTLDVKKIYLILDDDSADKIPYLSEIMANYDVEFVIEKLDKYIWNYLRVESPNKGSVFGKYALGKLLLPDIVKEDKVLYLDTDILVVKDISNLWKYGMDEYYIAGVKDFGIYKYGNIDELGIKGKYVNTGVIIFNLKKIREEKIQEKWFDIINSRYLHFPDQDAINMVCTKKTLYLSSIYNFSEDVTLELKNPNLARIYHYAGCKPDWVVNRYYGEEWCVIEEEFFDKFGWNKYKKI